MNTLRLALRSIGPAGRTVLAFTISAAIAGAVVAGLATIAVQAPWALGYVGAACFLLVCRSLAR